MNNNQEKGTTTDNALSSSLSPEVHDPVVAEYDLEAVGEMLGKSKDAVEIALRRNKGAFMAHYQRVPRGEFHAQPAKIRTLYAEEVLVLAGIMVPSKLREVRLRVGGKVESALVPGRVVGRAEIRERIFEMAGVTLEMRAADVRKAHDVLNDALEANQTKFFQKDGVVTDERTVKDHYARLDAAKTIYQAEGVDLKGGGESKTAVQVNTNVQLPDHWLDEKPSEKA